MEKYKICPCCKTKNPPTSFECMNCEADLTGVNITDEKTEKMKAENAAAQDTAVPVKMVRICECGAKNAPNARKCRSCHEDISDITPMPDVEEENQGALSFILSSLDGQFTYEIIADNLVIGRESTMSSYLAAKSYVSRSHARITKVNEELYIENLSNTNFTYVNNTKITKKVKLQNGDEIGLGGIDFNGNRQAQAAYFLVRIGSCM